MALILTATFPNLGRGSVETSAGLREIRSQATGVVLCHSHDGLWPNRTRIEPGASSYTDNSKP